MKLIEGTRKVKIEVVDMSKVKVAIVMFDNYTCPDDYLADGVIPVEPMTAKEIMDKDLEKVFSSNDYIVEEKIDGVRANVQFFANKDASFGFCRVFSRRQSVVTGFYGEKSDNLPQIRDIDIPDLEGTILDGELVIPNSDFKTTSAVLNCLPLEAVERQQSEGQVVFNAFDCLYFKGENIMSKSLDVRKKCLEEVLTILADNQVYSIKEVEYYPAFQVGMKFYYDIVKSGGEGIMIKNLHAPYEMKRTRAYQKLKKKLTRDVVVMGYTEPTMRYTGKFPNDSWDYWIDKNGEPVKSVNMSAAEMQDNGYIPVTRHWYNGEIGTVVYGVLASERMRNAVNDNCSDNYPDDPICAKLEGKMFDFVFIDRKLYVKVGECDGLTDADREFFTNCGDKLIGKVIEVECNEVFKDTGKMRHPRFVRMRYDKSAEECTWEAHID